MIKNKNILFNYKYLIFLILLSSVVLLTPIKIFALDEYIENFNINIKVNENNTFDIIEEIDMVLININMEFIGVFQ